MKMTLLMASSVVIGSLLSAPASAEDARASLDPFRADCDMSNSVSESLGRCKLSKSIPAGKRLVLETVTGAYYGDGAVLGAAYLTVERHRYVFPWASSGVAFGDEPRTRKFYGFNHYVQIYVDGPAILTFDAAGGAGGGSYSGWYSVSGYLVDLPGP